MSAKRTATTELNHDNWDQEDDEPEESEGFRIASKEVLDKRVIRTAKRRSNVTTAEGQKSVFSGFGGFNKTQKTSFDFLANLTNGKSSGGSNQEGSSLFSSKTFSNQSTALFTPSDIFNKTTNTDVNNKEGSSTLFTSKTFTPQSKGLFTPSDVSKPAPSKFENPSLQTTSSSTKSTAVENQTNVKNSESPFKNTTSTPINTNNFTYKPHSGNSDNPVSQTTNNIFSGQAENIISNKSVKLPSSSNTCSASPSHKCHFIIDTNKSQKNDTDDDYIIIKCDPTDEKTLNYYKNLAGLNISFSKWIKKNVDELPLCILSPTFKDYENHLKNIRAEYFNRDGAQGDFAQNVKSPKMPSVAQANNVVSHTAVISNKSTSSTTEEKKSSNMVFGTPASNNTQAKDMGSLFGKMAKEQSFTASNTAAQANNILSQTGATSHKSMSSTPEEKKSSNIVFGTPSPNCSQPKDMGSLFGNVPKVQSFTTFSSSAAHTNSILSHTHATTPVSTISKPDEKKSSSMIFGTPTTNNTQEKNIGSLFGNMQKMQSFTTSSSTAAQSNNILSHTHATTPVSTISKPDEKKSSSMIFGTPATNNTQEKNIGSLFGNMQKMQSFTTSSSTAAQSNNILSQTSVTSNESTHPIPEEKKSTNMIFGTPTSNNTQAKDMGSLFSNMPQVQSTTTSSSTTQSPTLGFSFGSSSVANSTPTTSSGGFTFGINNSPQTSLFATKPIVSNINGNSQFSFGAGKPFSFNSNIQRKDESNEETKEDEDEPPKVEYTPMVEENSVFERKCKIFVKKDGNFVDKGVGTLYIKKIEDSRKHQLLVRANTSLGTILLNLVLATSVPTQRMGKNNVMLVCIPTPDAKPPPTPVLIRVKTSEEADELLEKLNNYKQ